MGQSAITLVQIPWESYIGGLKTAGRIKHTDYWDNHYALLVSSVK